MCVAYLMTKKYSKEEIKKHPSLCFEHQDNCAICNVPFKSTKDGNITAYVNYSRMTSQTRDLVCGDCNYVLWVSNDDFDYFKKVVKFLEKFNKLR